MAKKLEDIARLAGVSRSTVSRVINNDPNVNSATRNRVWNIINEANFQPSSAFIAIGSRSRIDDEIEEILRRYWQTIPPSNQPFPRLPLSPDIAIIVFTVGRSDETATFPTLTPTYLAQHIAPYLAAIEELQHVLSNIRGKQSSEVTIRTISQKSPVSLSLNGGGDAIQAIKETITPWRRKHVEEMAHLAELEKQVEIENKKADVLEARARAQKERAEAQRIAAEAAKHRQEAESLRLENEKRRLETIELAMTILDKIAPNLDTAEKIGFIIKLLKPVATIAFSELDIELLGVVSRGD
jgi:hypothetical protein